jgi:hypothetical protein
MDWTITVAAIGGDGGRGGDGGAPGYEQAVFELTYGSEDTTVTTDATRGDAGDGGWGGDGGDATATIEGVVLGDLDETDNLIRLEAAATGGAGGAGGQGNTDVLSGADGGIDGIAGADGEAGARGNATIVFADIDIETGDGADILQIAAFFDGETHSLTLQDIRFAAGDGDDTLDLSAIFGGFGATVDVAAGIVTAGEGNGIAIEAVEFFRGTESADTFIDGVSEQVYFGGSGADVFVFAPGHGQDSINDFVQGEDLIDLTAFGYADFAEIEALLGYSPPDYEFPYAVVTTSGGTGISLSVPVAIVLTEADFIF